MSGRTIRTPEKERAFLDAVIASGGNISAACQQCDIGRTTIYEWREQDDVFDAALRQALEYGTDVMEDEVTRRAVTGTEKPVFYMGAECGRIREYSDTLAIFMLKARRPEKYKDRVASEISGPGGGAMKMETTITPAEAYRTMVNGE